MTRSMTRGARTLAGAMLASLALSGCASFWDDVTSRDFKFKKLFVKPAPLVVLRDSTDGDERAKAIRRLEEPKTHGGNDHDQDVMLEVLSKLATTDPQPLCRLVAVEKLGHFKDPRVPKILEAAFYNVEAFPPELATRIQCQAIKAMGETHNPECVPFLIQKLKEPLAERSDEYRQRLDRCIAAARALGVFKEAQASEALAQMLRTDPKTHRPTEDIALRDTALASLKESTGKDLPADYDAWEEFLHPRDDKALAKSKDKSSILNLASWFKKD